MVPPTPSRSRLKDNTSRFRRGLFQSWFDYRVTKSVTKPIVIDIKRTEPMVPFSIRRKSPCVDGQLLQVVVRKAPSRIPNLY